MTNFKRDCIECGKRFETESNVAKYCSNKCRDDSKKERQKVLMREKRLKNKAQKSISKKSFANRNHQKLTKPNYTDPYKKRMDQARKKDDWKTYYTLYKEQFLANEEEWGYSGRYVVNGIEIHEPDFVENVLASLEQ